MKLPNRRMGIEGIAKLLDTIAAPRQGERMLFLTDYPDGKPDQKALGRQELVFRWFEAASQLCQRKGCALLPLVKYRETGKPNAELPKTAVTQGGGHVDDLAALVESANIVIAMNRFSATAPLKNISARAEVLRVISMPGVSREMEGAMSADYGKIEERGKKLLAVVRSATGFEIVFDGAGVPRGTKLHVDARAGGWILDSGMCHKSGDFINFPSGELFTPPYEGVSQEGRREFGDSRTEGIWPVYSHADGRVAFLKIEKNRIVRVQGDCAEAERIVEDIAKDENAANVAEIAFGLNERARGGADVPVLEREKAGPHIAYGRNDHFGAPNSLAGKVRANVHVDFVYTRETPITATIFAVYPNGNRVLVAERGKVTAV